MYLKGYGVPRDPLKALEYFKMAADQGWVEGQLQLGVMHFSKLSLDLSKILFYFQET